MRMEKLRGWPDWRDWQDFHQSQAKVILLDTREVVEESAIIMVEAEDVLLDTREVVEVIIMVEAKVILALKINQTPGVYA